MARKIGILGGTFDPPHLGHLLIAQEVKEKLNLDQILFIPTALPPHKKKIKISPALARLQMVNLAVKNNPGFKVLDLELRRKGASYTVDTLRDLTRRYLGTQLFLILGEDNLNYIQSWKEPDEIFRLAKVTFVSRPGFKNKIANSRLKKGVFLKVREIDISSTEIRERIKKGKSIRYMVPGKVLLYIKRHNLYK
ncbi:MAG: nicotinate (nicotinamide) nucleotide adenylyltransferase [candidate division Zixibacteria bacterium RBG_16_40_9]|nr:MAG: nicotinate (nicotinamide) nucleotide adenylyltransferase [candidate division Zixibacteria bacterium RBG_16_40_9]